MEHSLFSDVRPPRPALGNDGTILDFFFKIQTPAQSLPRKKGARFWHCYKRVMLSILFSRFPIFICHG